MIRRNTKRRTTGDFALADIVRDLAPGLQYTAQPTFMRHDKIADMDFLNRNVTEFCQNQITSRETRRPSNEQVDFSTIFVSYFSEITLIGNHAVRAQFFVLLHPGAPFGGIFLVIRLGWIERMNRTRRAEPMLKHGTRERLDLGDEHALPAKRLPRERGGFNAGTDGTIADHCSPPK